MPEADDSLDVDIVGIIHDWFEGLDEDDVEDCAAEIVETLRLRRAGDGEDEEDIFSR